MSLSRPRRNRDASQLHASRGIHEAGPVERQSTRGEEDGGARAQGKSLLSEKSMRRSSSRTVDEGSRLVEEDDKAGGFGSPMAYEAAEPTVFQRPSSSQGRPRRESSLKETDSRDPSARAGDEKPKLRPRTSGGRRSSARVSDAADASLDTSLRPGAEALGYLGNDKSRKGEAQPRHRSRRTKASREVEEEAGEEEMEEEYEIEVDLDVGLEERFGGREKGRPQTSGGRQGRKGRGQEGEGGDDVVRTKSDASRESGERPRTSGGHRHRRKGASNSSALPSPRHSNREPPLVKGQGQVLGDGVGEHSVLALSSHRSRSSRRHQAEERAQDSAAVLEEPRVSRHRRQSSRGGAKDPSAGRSTNPPSSAKEFAIHSWVESTVAELTRGPMRDPGQAEHTGRRSQAAPEASGVASREEEDEDEVPVAGMVELRRKTVPGTKQRSSSRRGGVAGEGSLDGDSRVQSSSDASSSLRVGAGVRQAGNRLEAAAVGTRQGGIKLEAGTVLIPQSSSKPRTGQSHAQSQLQAQEKEQRQRQGQAQEQGHGLSPEEGRGGGLMRRGGSVSIPEKALGGLDLDGLSGGGDGGGALSAVPPRPPTASARTSQSHLRSPFLNGGSGNAAGEDESVSGRGAGDTRPATAAPSGKTRSSSRRSVGQDATRGGGLVPLGADGLAGEGLEGGSLHVRHKGLASEARRHQQGLESPR